jgi:hypothetical protein
MTDKCCSCGRELTQKDWERGFLIIEELRNPYTDEIDEVQIWCSNCHDAEFAEEEEEVEVEKAQP